MNTLHWLETAYDMKTMTGVRDSINPYKPQKLCFICQRPIAIGETFNLRIDPKPKLIWHPGCE